MTLLPEHQENVKLIGDALSITVVIGTLVEALPHIAAALTILWTIIRIWETPTVQGLVLRMGNTWRQWRGRSE